MKPTLYKAKTLIISEPVEGFLIIDGLGNHFIIKAHEGIATLAQWQVQPETVEKLEEKGE